MKKFEKVLIVDVMHLRRIFPAVIPFAEFDDKSLHLENNIE